jgi:heterogeneous nuclear ribonucleoprotein A1/A3
MEVIIIIRSSSLEVFYTLLKVIKIFNNYYFSSLESDIERYFRQFGTVVDVAIMRDKHSGKSRGFAFVTFKEKTLSAL